MAFRSVTATATTTTTPITIGETDLVAGRSLMLFVPADGQMVKVGGPDLTWTNGYPVPPGGMFAVDIDAGEQAYMLVQAGTQAVNCLWRGV